MGPHKTNTLNPKPTGKYLRIPKTYPVEVEGNPKGPIGGLPKIRGTILGAPIVRTIVYWGLYWGPLVLGNYHFCWILVASVHVSVVIPFPSPALIKRYPVQYHLCWGDYMLFGGGVGAV